MSYVGALMLVIDIQVQCWHESMLHVQFVWEEDIFCLMKYALSTSTKVSCPDSLPNRFSCRYYENPLKVSAFCVSSPTELLSFIISHTLPLCTSVCVLFVLTSFRIKVQVGNLCEWFASF